MAGSNSISILITAKDQASQTLRGVGRSIDGVTGGASRADAAFARFTGNLKVGLLAAGAAAAVGLGSAINATKEYESSLSKLRQASGATNAQMQEMSKLARQLGSDNTLAGVTASDAAKTMVELSKAGLSVKDTMAATRGTMSLAKAGNVQFADAAGIAASALNAFNMKGKDANKVADALAAGANASQAELSDLALGLQQSATVAKQFELSLNENITALALFANNGIRGSDAGTSLKTMLISLAKPSKESAAAMKEIGFNAYDAKGNFVGLEEMSSRLNKSLKGLTKEQRQNALATIFGTDAFRAAGVLADNAGKKYDKMSKAVGRVGAAHEAAKAQMGPHERALEGFNNAMSELGLSVGERVLPAFTDATNGATQFIQTLTRGLPGAIETVGEMMPLIKGVSAGIAALTVAQNAGAVATNVLATAQGALNAVMRLSPHAWLIGGLTGLIVGLGALTQQTGNNKNATDRLSDARSRLKQITGELKQSESDLKQAKLDEEGATLRVERAQKTYNDAVAQFGPKSLEAREAAHQLRRAKDDLANAARNAADKTDALKRKQKELAAQTKEVQTSESIKRAAFNRTSDSISFQTSLIGGLRTKLGALDGKTFGYTLQMRTQDIRTVIDGVSSPRAKDAAAARLKGHASGTPYAPGGLTLVGERGPELVSLPRGSQVTPAWKTRSSGSDAVGGGVTINFNGPVDMGSKQNIDVLVERVRTVFDKQQRLANKGMA